MHPPSSVPAFCPCQWCTSGLGSPVPSVGWFAQIAQDTPEHPPSAAVLPAAREARTGHTLEHIPTDQPFPLSFPSLPQIQAKIPTFRSVSRFAHLSSPIHTGASLVALCEDSCNSPSLPRRVSVLPGSVSRDEDLPAKTRAVSG